MIGPNDHSVYGYFQRLHVNGWLPPFGWAPDTRHAPVHVEDVGEGIALAAEKGNPGQTYLLAGEATNLRQVFKIWAEHQGGFKIRFFLPFWLAGMLFSATGPLLHWLGLPAFLSGEVVAGTRISLAYSSLKAQGELGWTYRPAREAWASTLAGERHLLARRTKCDPISRLKPVEELD